MLLTEILNSVGAIGMLAIGTLLIIQGLGGADLIFLVIGVVLILLGLFQFGYRLVAGKWFRFFGH